jgi:hypothetical protein
VVQGLQADRNNQPVLKTSKGDQTLFKPRLPKLMAFIAICGFFTNLRQVEQ